MQGQVYRQAQRTDRMGEETAGGAVVTYRLRVVKV